jgi:RHS repeat-associated protein
VDHYTYSPYGQQTAVSNGASNPFGFDGGLQVPGTGLIHFGARYYNPALGQWTQLDPTGQNPGYTYTGDNPINNTDLNGQISSSCGLAIVLLGFGAIGVASGAIGLATLGGGILAGLGASLGFSTGVAGFIGGIFGAVTACLCPFPS